MIYY